MEISIAFEEAPEIETSLALNELRDFLQNSDINAEPTLGKAPEGTKDGGLTLGLAIAGLALAAIGNLIAAITLWGSKRNYSIVLKCGDSTISANNLSASESVTIADSLKDKALASDIQVLVSLK
jgi:hypothetical protein